MSYHHPNLFVHQRKCHLHLPMVITVLLLLLLLPMAHRHTIRQRTVHPPRTERKRRRRVMMDMGLPRTEVVRMVVVLRVARRLMEAARVVTSPPCHHLLTIILRQLQLRVTVRFAVRRIIMYPNLFVLILLHMARIISTHHHHHQNMVTLHRRLRRIRPYLRTDRARTASTVVVISTPLKLQNFEAWDSIRIRRNELYRSTTEMSTRL